MRLIYYSYIYYDLGPSNKSKEKSCTGLTQENSMEFQLQSVYLIYT